MPDVFSKAKRSEVMSRIRSTGNKDTEQKLAALMRAAEITGWRRQAALKYEVGKMKDERGTGKVKADRKTVRPDFVFRAERVAVFVDGCFWHGCPRHATRPRQNRAFWDAKLARNEARDRVVTRGLRKAGWQVLRIWECALAKNRQAVTLRRIERALGR